MSELYLLEINNDGDYGDYEFDYTFVIAGSPIEAYDKARVFMTKTYGAESKLGPGFGYKATLIDQVDGFKITVEKMEDES